MAADRVDEDDRADRPAGADTIQAPARAAETDAAPAPDRAAETDAARAPERPAGSGTGRAPAPGDAAAEDPEYRAITRRLHRVLVDHTYGVARDAWAQAAPDLRAAWENHQARYPERVQAGPQAMADGGWASGPGRRLSPEQNAEAAKACADLADEGMRDILPALKRVEGAEPDRKLAGLQHMLKGEDRLKEKIGERLTAKPGRSVQQVLDGISDPVRFTFCYTPQRYADGVLTDVERLKAEGFELIKLKNLWTEEQYKGINSQWRRQQTGLRVEVQFHTPESLEAKELTHGAYERIRGSASPAERQELEGFQRRVNAYLVTPEGTEQVKDYPEERDGKHGHLLRHRR